MHPLEWRVALGVLEDARGRILLLRRSAERSFAPGLWGLPGGSIDPGESPAAAMRRELREELGPGVRIRKVRTAGPVRDTWYGGRYEVHLFLYRYLGGPIRLDPEHDRHAWVSSGEYRSYAVVDGVDEDLAYLRVWPPASLNPEKLPPWLRAEGS